MRTPKYAIHFDEASDCGVDFVGEVVRRNGDQISVQLVDAVMLTGCALWMLTDRVESFPTQECGLFYDKQLAALACNSINKLVSEYRTQKELTPAARADEQHGGVFGG